MKQTTAGKTSGTSDETTASATAASPRSTGTSASTGGAGTGANAGGTSEMASSASADPNGSAETSAEQGNKGISTAETKGKAPLEKFFIDSLQDIYSAEKQLTKALPKMEDAATTEELKEAFSDHLHQTEKQIRRLEKVFKLLGKSPEAKKCEAMEGLAKEADTVIKNTDEGSMTRDAALIIAAQKVEHYEIASYGGLVQLALTMDLGEVADLLDTTLMEEEDTDQQLTDIAEGHINMDAEHEGANYSWSTDESKGRDGNDDEDMEDDDDI